MHNPAGRAAQPCRPRPQDLLDQMSAPERLAATTDAESAAAAVVQAAAAQSKKLGAKAARAWRQLPDGGWQRRQAGDAPDPPRSRCAARPRRLPSLDSPLPAARGCEIGPGPGTGPSPDVACAGCVAAR